MSTKRICVIGAGFAGIAASAYLAKEGHEVTVLEKNDMPGGRARKFTDNGYTFDMGPSWYWMPDIFEDFYGAFGHKTDDFYDLRRLDPSYSVFFKDERLDLPAGQDSVEALFEKLDPGSGPRLNKFLEEAQYKYDVGIKEFVERPGHSLFEFAEIRVLRSLWRLDMLGNISASVSKVTQHPLLRQILEFPVLFLGAKPSKTPALYSLMNYADMTLGTWYPMGGMHEIVKAMVSIAEEQGVQFKYGREVESVDHEGAQVTRIKGRGWEEITDGVIVACDYHHFEQKILDHEYRRYSDSYWEQRTMAPSSLLYYVGVKKKLKGLDHHNLFFDADFPKHAQEIYDHPEWPSDPLFYVCAPSVTDPSVAPEGHENLFFLIPVAPGLDDNEEIHQKYFDIIVERLEHHLGTDVKAHIDHYRAFGTRDFIRDYHSFKGNAYGLANTLAQTAFLKPKMRHPKFQNLLYAGQLTTPGPGVPPSIISGRVSARELNNVLSKL